MFLHRNNTAKLCRRILSFLLILWKYDILCTCCRKEYKDNSEVRQKRVWDGFGNYRTYLLVTWKRKGKILKLKHKGKEELTWLKVKWEHMSFGKGFDCVQLGPFLDGFWRRTLDWRLQLWAIETILRWIIAKNTWLKVMKHSWIGWQCKSTVCSMTCSCSTGRGPIASKISQSATLKTPSCHLCEAKNIFFRIKKKRYLR